MKQQPLRRLLSLLLLTASMLSALPLAAEVTFTIESLTYMVGDGSTVSVSECDQNATGDLTIPESVKYGGVTYSVTSIGEYAFHNCSSLASVEIPNSVTTIGEWAFSDCSSLTSVTIPNSVTNIGDNAFSYCSSLTSVAIPNSVTSIGERAFCDCSSLTSVEIPSSVTSIGGYAFYDCDGLTSVTIPNSVTSIGDKVFWDCNGLTSVTIPSSVTSIGAYAFERCKGLTDIQVDLDNPCYCSLDGVLFTSDKSKLITFPAGKAGEYQIPSSVTSIDGWAFSECSSLTSVTIPNSVTSIGAGTFSGCSGLMSVTIPNSITEIGFRAFQDCSSLTSVTIPSSVTGIDNLTFLKCSNLTSVTIPTSVTYIGAWAFSECSSLTSATIPCSVTSIGEGAFEDCGSLKSVYCNATTPPSIASDTFSPSLVTLHVPTGCSDKYRNSQYWSDFNNIVDDIIPPSGIYLGVIGFNRELYEKPIGLLNENNVKTYTDFVNTFENSLRNTLLYYSVDYALDRIIEPDYPEDLTNAIIITFTDGLDKGSLVERPELMGDEDYVELLKNKIANTKVQGLDLQAYSLGVKGNDVTNTVLFNTNLSSLATNPEYANMLENIDDLDRKFNDIYRELETQTMQRIISISVPVMSNQQVCRFTLDGTSDNSEVNNSRIWVEGTYDRKTLELKNVSYKGFTSSSGSTVQGITDPNNRYNVVFTFNDCKDTEGNILNIEDKNDINQWLLIEDSNEWQPNSEMVQDEDIDIEVTKTSAVIMLLLDSSYSLGVEDFAKIKSQANAFIERLAGVNSEQSGVEDVCADRSNDVVDWSGAECYNMQGVRIDNPVTGLYIQRVGNHSRKIFVR